MAWLSLTSRCVIGNRVCSRMLKRGGVAGTIPVLAQRAASEGPRWTRAFGLIPATPYKGIARCGLARGTARLGAPGLGG